MAPITRSQTIIMRKSEGKYNGGKNTDTDIEYLTQLIKAVDKTRCMLFLVKRHTKHCFYCQKLFARERHPRPEVTPVTQQCDCPLFQHVRLIRQDTRLFSVKTGPHGEMVKSKLPILDGIVRVTTTLARSCQALKSMPPRRCSFCYKFCASDPQAYLEKNRENMISLARQIYKKNKIL